MVYYDDDNRLCTILPPRLISRPYPPARCCCCCCPCPPATAVGSFTAVKRAEGANTPLSGAVYGLFHKGVQIRTAVSDTSGNLSFAALTPGEYLLREQQAPEGYQLQGNELTVRVSHAGAVTISGKPAYGYNLYNVPLSQFSFFKRDALTGLPLPGATFLLSTGAQAVSDSIGLVNFGSLDPGTYTMTETTVPPGYLPNRFTYVVAVSDSGSITVDGIPLAGFALENRRLLELLFRKFDAVTGLPLPGAVFLLSTGAQAESDARGYVDFGVIAPGNYTIQELSAPSGYLPSRSIYRVLVAPDGDIFVDGASLEGFSVSNRPSPSLAFQKRDSITGLPLSGAAFRLSTGAAVSSGSNGIIDFGPLIPGLYELEEIRTPTGYLPNNRLYSAEVLRTGEILVDGLPLAAFAVRNAPYPVFSFRKFALDTGSPLAGAVFELEPGRTAVSDSTGLVDFGQLPPGAYKMREIVAPADYEPEPSAYLTVVEPTGEIFVNGAPLSSFAVYNRPSFTQSPPPILNPIIEQSRCITGCGNPGAEVTVIFPDGTQSPAAVEPDGGWGLVVPYSIILISGGAVSARQTIPGMLPSAAVSQTVETQQ